VQAKAVLSCVSVRSTRLRWLILLYIVYNKQSRRDMDQWKKFSKDAIKEAKKKIKDKTCRK